MRRLGPESDFILIPQSSFCTLDQAPQWLGGQGGIQMFRTLQAAFLVFCFAASAVAHHSRPAVYRTEDPAVTMRGTVTRVEWQNPHIWFYIDVVDDAGNVTNWEVELAGASNPARMYRRGWPPDSMKVGDVVTVTAALARDGSLNRVSSNTVIMPDGRQLGR